MGDVGKWARDAEKFGSVENSDIELIVNGSEACKYITNRLLLDPEESCNPTPCLVAANARAKELERDFTTNGVQGNLHCPYAIPNGSTTPSGQANGDLEACGHEDLDPIKAEFGQDNPSIRSMSRHSSIPRCPIRYLENHSPEELAQFFQNHKHEIPRSHAICIQRYQKDSQSIRQLDQKYGNMVNMIKGLGLYHKPYLPDRGGEEEDGAGGGGGGGGEEVGDAPKSSSVERVEKWAEDVNTKSPKSSAISIEHEQDNEDGQERQSHFDRPLKDVRVGESPSRPWGIHVPITHHTTPSAIASSSAGIVGETEPKKPLSEYDRLASDQSSLSTPVAEKLNDPSSAGRCPFHAAIGAGNGALQHVAEDTTNMEHQARSLPAAESMKGTRIKDEPPDDPSAATSNRSPAPNQPPQKEPQPSQVVFNGPVILGYSAEEAATLIQQLGSSTSRK